MSDQPLGPGWWQASDLKWYPPPTPPASGGEPVPGQDDEPGSGGAPGLGSDTRQRRPRWLAPAAALLVVASLAAGATLAVVAGDDAAQAATVALEPVDSTGPDPFTESVSVIEVAEFPDAVRAVTSELTAGLSSDGATGTLVATGTAPGLYGGTRDDSACDAAKLAEHLDAEPAKADAWSEVVGVDPAEIDRYLDSLVPVVLTADTWVTNHGFRDGAATPRSAVLQAGTAVMVDATGTPRVRCSCGNPLSAAPRGDLSAAATTGSAWSGYSPGSVTVVRPGEPTGSLTVVDLADGDTFQLPVGAAPSTTATTRPTTTSAPAPTTTVAPTTTAARPAPVTLEELNELTVSWPDSRQFNRITFVDGSWRSPDGFGGSVVFERKVGDLDGDGVDDGVVLLRSNGGGNAEWSDVFVVPAADRVPRWIDHESVVQSAWSSGVSQLDIADGRLQFMASKALESDPRCCPSGQLVLVYRLEGGEPVLESQRPAAG